MAIMNSLKKQQGIVLITTLLMVAVLSLLVASMMMGAGSQQKMSFNAQSQNQTFQAADSAIEEVINDIDAVNKAIDGGVGGQSLKETFTTDISRLRSQGQVTFKGMALAVGEDLTSSEAFMYEAEGQGFIDDNSVFNDADDEARTRLLQGAYRINRAK